MKSFVYKLPPKSEKQNFIFNMVGSLANAAVSMVLLIVVSRIAGDSDAGIFSMAYTTAQMIYTICVFEMRNIQVTDAKHEFSFSNVVAFRFISIAVAWAFFVGFSIYKGYSGEKFIVMLALVGYMTLLSLSDLFQGNMHLNGFLSLAGKSLACEVLIASIMFTVTLLLTKNLVISILMMVAVVALWLLFYDIPYSNNFASFKPNFNFIAQKNIFLCAIPLFFSSFMHQYVFNSPKYAIDEVLGSVEQSHYGYLVMPAFFINLLSIFVFRPQLVPLSQKWTGGEYKRFAKTSIILFAWIAIVTVAALVVGYLIGIPVLELLYNTNLSGKRHLLIVLLLAGSFSAGCSLASNLITIMRKQKYCLIAHIITFTTSLFLPKLLVVKIGMLGATLSYLIEMAILFIVMLVIFILAFHKAKGAKQNG